MTSSCCLFQGSLPKAIPWVQVQDEATGLVVSLLDPQPGESILDACAAPGGKTLFIAARMKNQVPKLDHFAHHLLSAAQSFIQSCGISGQYLVAWENDKPILFPVDERSAIHACWIS